MNITAAQLSPWADADELLPLLYELGDPQPDLRDALMGLFEHEAPDVRAETVRILVRRWKDAGARPLAFTLLKDDPDAEVRAAASYAIGATSSPTRRDQDRQVLIDVLRDTAQPVEVRSAAYEALLIAHRRATFPTKKRPFDPATDVDWDWIEGLERT